MANRQLVLPEIDPTGAPPPALADGTERYFNGYVSNFSQGGRDHHFVYYHAEIVPWLWFLTQTSNCRIFQDKTVPDIIEQIFKNRGMKDYSLKLYGSPLYVYHEIVHNRPVVERFRGRGVVFVDGIDESSA